MTAKVEEVRHHSPKEPQPAFLYPNQIYAWYVVGVLVLAYTFSFIDRQILSLLVQPMKHDLAISDTQMSLLQGFAFAIFYTLMGLPIGRMVDHRRRVTIITAGVFIWSLMTVLCGTAKAYWQLFIYRMGVGVGEAALSPAAYSMIADYVPPKRMGLALGVYGMGVYIGAGLALVIGAEVIALVSGMQTTMLPGLGEIYPWQIVFFAVGLPGILIAAWIWTLREPARRSFQQAPSPHPHINTATAIPLPEVLAYMRANWIALTCHNMAYAFSAMAIYGLAAWIPTFFIRTHGWTVVEAGRGYGWIIVIFGTAGVVIGGLISDFLASRGIRHGRMLTIAATGLAAAPFALAYPLVANPYAALALLVPATFFASLITGASPAAIQELMPNQMRGFASAVMLFAGNIIGLGLGPTSVALVTDYVYENEQMLRYSLAYVPFGILLASSAIGFAGLKPYRKSLDYLERWSLKNKNNTNKSIR